MKSKKKGPHCKLHVLQTDELSYLDDFRILFHTQVHVLYQDMRTVYVKAEV